MPTSSPPEAAVDLIIAKTLGVRGGTVHTLNVRSVDGSPVLRQKHCHNSDCTIVFDICVSCDRGQIYCSGECREAARRLRRSEANRRYQASQKGRDAHRRCQRRYRDRSALVTDQGPPLITSPQANLSDSKVLVAQCRCVICGKASRWINPYPPPPPLLWSAKRSKNYVFP